MTYRVSLMLTLGGALLLIGCASKQYVPKEDEELYSSWVEAAAQTGAVRQMVVISADGSYKRYPFTESKTPKETCIFEIEDRWTDSEGNVFYNVVFDKALSSANFRLFKISNSGTVLEEMIDLREFATKIDQKHYEYEIYYRQK